MSDYVENYRYGTVAANAAADERADFIRKTYLHLTGAVVAFAILEAFLIQSNLAASMLTALMGGGRVGWLLLMLGFIGVSYVANAWAMSGSSPALQYAGLSLYVVVEAVICCPLIFFASQRAPETLPIAAGITLALFGGLTFIVFITGKDFSFMRSVLWLAGLVALGLIVCSMIFGFQLGIVFVIAMIAFAAGYILYDTSNVLHHYRVGQHVAASLALFASVVLLFWYVLRLVLAMSRRD